ncbi:hypothetical protein O2N63_06170, partial [Aliiroseovarius sp. KMU-50]|nr:hypothetical protein [Aliiroseovarius sp. KMU-50]
ADYVTGGDGFDQVSYRQEASYGGTAGLVMQYDFNGGERIITDGWGNTDTLLDIEWIVGTGVGDTLRGNPDDERLEGRGGNDLLAGYSGNDTLIGGTGDDTLYGDSGDDVIFGDEGNDTIVDNWGNDTMSGGLDADEFVFQGTPGNDVVVDFSLGEDAVRLDPGLSATSATQIDHDGDGLDDTAVVLTSATSSQTVVFLDTDSDAISAYFDLL